MKKRVGIVMVLLALLVAGASAVEETLWIEAEHLDGIQGSCWPMARGGRYSAETHGHWGISGPGWAAEYNQGGESAFLSIACGADDDQAVATRDIELPVAGTYHIWVRYRDSREASDRFQVTIEQPNIPAWSATFGETPLVDEDDEAKLYWEGAFGWEEHAAALKKGVAKLALCSGFKEPQCRQVDCIVLTTDASYHPLIKERPRSSMRELLDQYRKGIADDLEPLAKRTGAFDVPEVWIPKTFKPGFVYLWNTRLAEEKIVEQRDADGRIKPTTQNTPPAWMTGDTNGILYPHFLPPRALELFRKKYAGEKDVPIFSDPRIVPVFRGIGPGALGLAVEKKPGDPKTPDEEVSEAFMRWLDADPNRLFGNLLNYYSGKVALSAEGKQAFFEKYQDRYVGGISGGSLGYFYLPPDEKKKLNSLTRRRQYVDRLGALLMAANTAKYRDAFGDDIKRVKNAYAFTIPCQSLDGISFFNLCYLWGAETVGFESSSAPAGLLSMRTAFLRGAARQHGKRMATYRSCNFGDASTIFSSETYWYARPENIFDNYYSVYSGAGMTWYKMDIWYQYMAGSACFYHEQGGDEFWMPGGLTVAGQWGLQLSPKGKLVDRFLRLTAENQHFDRGTPFTPVAILVDYAHGWDPSSFNPRHWGEDSSDVLAARLTLHDKAMAGLFWAAYHPIGAEGEKPMTTLNEVYVHGIFGDIFDVIYAYPDVKRWTTLDTYPLVMVGGSIAMTSKEGDRLNHYVEAGGTLVVADGQIQGSGLARLKFPELGDQEEADEYLWMTNSPATSTQRYRFKPITGGRPLATTPDGKSLCAAFEQGQGRLIFISIPYALGIDQQPHPVLARVMAHATRGLMPVEVKGDVEWCVNRNKDGWMVTLLNAAGQLKPQQGIVPTDYRENRKVRVESRVPITSAVDRLRPSDNLEVRDNAVECVAPAGGVRILELK